jgi:putative flippase GtrA
MGEAVRGSDVETSENVPATVDLIVPVYNEEVVLESSIRRLHAYLDEHFPLGWQVTIVDNASTDDTWNIACRLRKELDNVEAIHLDEKGRGRALRTGWLASESPVVAYMDVDLSTRLDAFLPLVAPLVSGHSDVAIGTRLAPGARVERGPKREVISRAYNLLLKAALRNGFSDAQCGFKAVRSDVAQDLLPLVEDQEWFFDTELLVLAEHNGPRIHEVPVDWVDDPDTRVDVVLTAHADLRGIWRMLRRMGRGTATISTRTHRSQQWVEPGLAGQVVRFGSIGVVSTVLFAVLFALLAGPLDPVLGAVVAMAVCGVVNTAANRRVTFALRGRTDRVRHFTNGLLLNLLPLSVTLGTVWTLGLLDITSRPAQILWLTLTNATATLVRFFLLRHWVFGHRALPPTVINAHGSSSGPLGSSPADGRSRAPPAWVRSWPSSLSEPASTSSMYPPSSPPGSG